MGNVAFILISVFPPSSSVPSVSHNNIYIYIWHSFFPIIGEGFLSLFWHMKFNNFCDRSFEKRVSAVTLSNDGLYVCFADKFGVVWVAYLNGFDGNQALVNKKAQPMLAHYCSIITSLVSVAIF